MAAANMFRLAVSASAPRAFARSLSTSVKVADAGLVRPALQLHGVDGRYAHALFSAASKQGVLEKVEKELGNFKNLVATDGALGDFLESPLLSRAEKSSEIQRVLKTQGYSDTVVNFFRAMAENNRLPETHGILNAFDTLMSSHRNEVTCRVVSAAPMTDKMKNSVNKSLKGFTAEGQVLKTEYTVDPSILGGLTVEIGDKFVDMSTVTKVKKITQVLQQTI
eukprot:m.332476 g.332476  ORF g.332476 m.332476 type:complete len:222 (-) comp16954_c0_seq1:159-824(-)